MAFVADCKLNGSKFRPVNPHRAVAPSPRLIARSLACDDGGGGGGLGGAEVSGRRTSPLRHFCLAPAPLLLIAPPAAPGRSLHRRLKFRPKSSSSSGAGAASGAVGGNGGQHHHHATPSDSAIDELERLLEDKEWELEHCCILRGGEGDGDADEHTKEWEEFLKEEEDFINDDERLNLADRIRALFPKIDLAPQDGFVSLDELTRWNLEQASADQLHRSAREMELYDKNGDGIVSFGAFRAVHEESHGNATKIPAFICTASRSGRQ